jgi:hypothetical protein
VGSRMESRNDDDGESSSNLELPSTVDDGVSDESVAQRIAPPRGRTLQSSSKPAPLPLPGKQRPRMEKSRPAKVKKRSVIEPVSRDIAKVRTPSRSNLLFTFPNRPHPNVPQSTLERSIYVRSTPMNSK